jgi:hypothetical protein
MLNDLNPADRALTIEEFCHVEHISKSSYYKLKRAGLAPEETCILNLIRISPEARAKWHEMLAARRQSAAAVLESERKHAQTAQAGRAAAQSPNHASRRAAPARRRAAR